MLFNNNMYDGIAECTVTKLQVVGQAVQISLIPAHQSGFTRSV